MELEERDIRNAFSTLEGRNQAYTRKYECIGETAYLDRAVEKLGEFTQRIYPAEIDRQHTKRRYVRGMER